MLRVILVASAVALSLSAAEAAAAGPGGTPSGPGGIGVRLADAPASARKPQAHSYVIERVTPGATTRRHVEIINTTTSVAEIRVYASAARIQNGAFTFAAAHRQNELSRWTSVSPASIKLEPGTSVVDTVTIDVPREAAKGERYAVVWAAISAPARPGGGVTLVNRVGMRMYVSVGPGGTGALGDAGSFSVTGVTARRTTSGQPLLIATIANTGTWTLDLAGNLTLASGPAGLRAADVPVRVRPPLPPGIATQIQIPLDPRLPPGPWRARLHLRSGTTARTSAATLTFPPWAAPATLRHRHWPVVTIALVGALALLALALGALALLFTRRAPGASA